MTKENKMSLLAAVYTICFFHFQRINIIDSKTGRPVKLPKHLKTEPNMDALAIYTYIAEQTIGRTENQIRQGAANYNELIEGLEDEYYFNNFFAGIFIVDKYITEHESRDIQIRIGSKVNRLLKYLREKILEVNKERGAEIVTDSSYFASNVYRIFNSQAELTKEMRIANRDRWKEAMRKKQKEPGLLNSLK